MSKMSLINFKKFKIHLILYMDFAIMEIITPNTLGCGLYDFRKIIYNAPKNYTKRSIMY